MTLMQCCDTPNEVAPIYNSQVCSCEARSRSAHLMAGRQAAFERGNRCKGAYSQRIDRGT